MARKFFVGGNWKNNGTLASISEIVNNLNAATIPSTDVVEVVVAPVAVHIPFVLSHIRPDIFVSSQNVWVKGSGAFTGEISAEILLDLGLKWTITGHSERRALLGETSEFVADKTLYAISKGLNVIACIGETLEERNSGNTLNVVTAQTQALADKFSIEDWSKVVIAYEPVWAIGTGVVATPEQAQEVHNALRLWFAEKVSPEVAAAIRIIYGGSVTAANATTLATQADIDGFLVGGASLKPEFVDIINSATAKVPAA